MWQREPRLPLPKPGKLARQMMQSRSNDMDDLTLALHPTLRILCVVDDFTRECLTLVADTSLSRARVARVWINVDRSPGGKPF